ncbi:MAG: sensor histidine kinase [Myxococcales bacterium]
MAETSELIEFRRAFVWLLCGMLLPSVALVAFGVVAVANERAAVERRLAVEYDARLRTLSLDLLARLDRAADTVAARRVDPLVANIRPLVSPPPELAEAARRAATLPIGGHVFANTDSGTERRAYALVRAVRESGEQTLLAQLDVAGIASQVQRLAELKYPREAAAFRLVPPREPVAALAALRRIVAEAGQAGTVVSRIGLGPPLEGFALVAELPGDPAAPLAFRNRTLYIALLVLLYVGIGVGFGLTLREMRRAYKLSRLKTDFVANISHELRTPLTSVRLFAETLRQGRVQGAEQQECLDQLANEAQRLSGMVEKLLDWSRLESGRKALRRERTDLRGLFDHVQEIFRAQQLGTTYQTEIDPGLPAVAVDRDAMAQAVLNLLHNAVKYTGPDKLIRLRGRRGGNGTVAIEVADNGVGIRPHERKRIFERFYRADDLLSRHTEGTGLGLAIAKRIVEAHGGRIEVESQEGKGSTFRIEIPATR